MAIDCAVKCVTAILGISIGIGITLSVWWCISTLIGRFIRQGSGNERRGKRE